MEERRMKVLSDTALLQHSVGCMPGSVGTLSIEV